MRPRIISALLHVGLAFSLLFSAAEVSRVGLFVAASFANSDCGNMLCTCGTSNSCGDAAHPGENENIAGIPQLFDASENTETTSCCPSEAASSTDEENLHAHKEASVCGCGQLPGDEDSGLIKPLEKTVFLPAAPGLKQPSFRFLKHFLYSSAHPAFPDEVFHPPKYA
ncbi:MAG: hypothetical protein ACOC2C_00105 [Cyclonatronaceae bacterium]